MDAVALADDHHHHLRQRFPLPWNSSFLPGKLATHNPSVFSIDAKVGFSDVMSNSGSSSKETGNDEFITHCSVDHTPAHGTVDGALAESRTENGHPQEGHDKKVDDVDPEISPELGAQVLQNECAMNEYTCDGNYTNGFSVEYRPSTDAPIQEGTIGLFVNDSFSSSDCFYHTDTSDSLQSPSVSETCPSPVFCRSKTVPSGPSSSITIDGNIHNLFRSQTEKKGNGKKHSDAIRHSPSPAEKLSERERKRIIENFVKIQNDGTVEVDVDRSVGITPNLFDLDIPIESDNDQTIEDPLKVVPSALNIAMLIVGTRGDVQPFVAIGRRLKEKGHRVRLATHSNFRDFVTNNGLEFFPLGGDPKLLAQYMVKNKGFVPSGPSEISIQKRQLRAIMHSLLPACTRPDGPSGMPFVADAIIANPPAYGHVHVAEYLNVPVHIFFTMPWTPTYEFPHPLARVKQHAAYKISYHVVDFLVWWAIRGLVNEFRVKELKLNPIYFNMNQGSIAHLPTGYIWSPHLVPKPKDWGPKVDVVGFCFLDLANDYKPPEALLKWLDAGEKPIYVGFGSLPLEHPMKMSEIIVRALQETKQRGIIDKGWGGLGCVEIPDSIFLLENCPHDWLFPQCAAVVHHGGAGTTAAGLKAGCPTTIVPFFGDQPFWGERVHARGVGPEPIPVQQFSLERLVDAINFMLDEEVKSRAVELAKQMEQEDGVGGAVDVFYKHWVKRSPQPSVSAGSLNFFETILISLQRLWCLPWCFE